MDDLSHLSMASAGGFAVETYKSVAEPDAVDSTRTIGGTDEVTFKKQVRERPECIEMTVKTADANRTKMKPDRAEGDQWTRDRQDRVECGRL